MCVPRFVHPVVCRGHLDCFYLLAVVSSAAVDTSVQPPPDPVFILLCVSLEVGLLDHMVVVALGAAVLFSLAVPPFL